MTGSPKGLVIGMSEASVEAAPEPVGDLPPSCRLVWLFLEVNPESTQKEIARGTCSSTRTVRYALDRLEAASVVGHRPSMRDARQKLYYVDEPPGDSTGS